MFLPAHIKNDGLVVLVCWDWDHWRLRIVPENLVFSINTAFINIIIILIYQIWRTNTYNHKSPVHCNTRVSPMFKPKWNIFWVVWLFYLQMPYYSSNFFSSCEKRAKNMKFWQFSNWETHFKSWGAILFIAIFSLQFFQIKNIDLTTIIH